MPSDETPTAVTMTDPGSAPAPGRASEIELYKLAVEFADRISARRALANTFFLTVNTGLAALLGGTQLRWYVAVAGLLRARLVVAAAELPQTQLGEIPGDQRHRGATPRPAVLG
jgi:hypothetical protein